MRNGRFTHDRKILEELFITTFPINSGSELLKENIRPEVSTVQKNTVEQKDEEADEEETDDTDGKETNIERELDEKLNREYMESQKKNEEENKRNTQEKLLEFQLSQFQRRHPELHKSLLSYVDSDTGIDKSGNSDSVGLLEHSSVASDMKTFSNFIKEIKENKVQSEEVPAVSSFIIKRQSKLLKQYKKNAKILKEE